MRKALLTAVLALVIALPVGARQPPVNRPPFNSIGGQAKELRQDFQNQVDQIREQFKATLDAKRAEFQQKLQALKDARKKEVVARLQDRLDALNKQWTDHFTDVMAQLQDVLDRIGSRTDKAATRGLDVTAVRTAIASAKTAIDAAKAAILAQAAKQYTINITTDAKLGMAVKAVRKQLHDDLAKLRDMVKAARDKVHAAATTLAQIPRVDEDHPPMNAPENNEH